ncbi:MAG: C4-type zinc ribbon domain-containing protein [Rikenellaceae bacterium]
MATSSKKGANGSEITIEDKIVALYELQQIDSKIDEINRIKGELPYEVQDLEDEIEGIDTRIKKLASEVEELTKRVRAKKESIEISKIKVAKYEEQKNNVRNNREYDVLEKEIEFENLEIELLEKRIKELNSESKGKKKRIEETKSVLNDRKIDLDIKKKELETIDAETSEEIAELNKLADDKSSIVDDHLLKSYRTIRKGMKNGLAVVSVKRKACGGCFNQIPPQRQLDIRISKKIIVCEYCGRILVSDKIEETEE